MAEGLDTPKEWANITIGFVQRQVIGLAMRDAEWAIRPGRCSVATGTTQTVNAHGDGLTTMLKAL
jgi:hypothetical protein